MLFYVIVFCGAGALGKWMGGKRSGAVHMILTALASGTVGVVAGVLVMIILTSAMGLVPVAGNGPEMAFKALFLGMFFGGMAARQAQAARRV